MTKISPIQAYMMIILSVGLMNHVIIIPLLLGASGRDSWLVVLLVFVASPIWIGCLNYILKYMKNQHFKKWLEHHFGKFVSALLVIIYSLFVWVIGFITLKDTLTWTTAAYLPQTPMLFLAGTTLVACFFVTCQGLSTIAIVSGILLPFVVIFGFLVSFVNIQFKEYTLLFPLLENGVAPLWKGVPYVAGGLMELFLLMLLLQHNLSKKPGFGSLMLLCLILTGLTLGPLIGSITIFGPDEAANQRYPPYAQWRIVRMGEYVEHVDFFSIYQWLSGTFIRVCLSIFLLGELWNLKKRRWFPMLLGTIAMLVAILLPISDMAFLDLLGKFYLPSFCIFTIATLILYVVRIIFSK
ncbi:endospore germination permease [Cytobacillus firmus]|uniref:GerAB/ArcD/ProY family transporter n=1 Tax=Cytobacillus TaxID=2675230 RepID=UPI00135A44A7|nr:MULTISPECIES: endospore germination permease [Cytobacillus]KAF0817389.1 Nutrient germinant receptor inner membrane subunit B (GerKB/GerAB/GerBB) [Bacillus sp. ZZV12-4809]MCM3089837.1 endospore germination permease [Cytobacillus sp. AMY 15.2]URM31081.1 endospore germination permease [Cytobacillus firmus]